MKISRYKIPIAIGIAFFILSCSKEQSNEIAITVAKSYNESYRDNVIKNWQAKVVASQNCNDFKIRFKNVGERYDNASNGAFMQDMTKIWDATKSSGCALQN